MRRELGLLVLPERPVSELVERARRAEALGYDTVWVADEKFYRDPWVVLAAMAGQTERVRLGTAVTEPYSRHPALIAMAVATLLELAPGRLTLGLGSGGPGFPPMGVVRRRPTIALREAVTIIRGLLAGERLDVEGEVLSFRNGALNFESQPVPVYVAARGTKVLGVAGAVADGVIMAPFASPAAIEYAAALVEQGAREAGRPSPRIVARVDVCIASTRDAAREAVRYFVALPVWVSYPNWEYAEALGIRLPDAMRVLTAQRDYRDIGRAGELLPPEMIDHFAVAGTETDVAARLRELLPLVDELIVHPVASPDLDVDGVVETVAGIWAEIAAHHSTREGR